MKKIDYNHSIDFIIVPPTFWVGYYVIVSKSITFGTRETPASLEVAQRLLDKLYGVRPQLMEDRIVIHGWMKTRGER